MTCLVMTGSFVAITTLAGEPGPPATAVPEDPAHQELRAVRDAMVAAFNQRDYDGFLRHLHPNIVATWQDGEVVRHPEGVKAFMKKMSEGETKVVESVQADLKVDELTSLYNNKQTGVAFGSVEQNFKLANGKQLLLNSRWTASFIKEDNRWLLAAFHVSADVFDNPVLGMAVKKTAMGVGLGAAAIGLILGWVLGRSRKAKAPAAS
ncbi:MAG TPA: nuclear transport factor 2 family protein [Verrucomicrobiae bacterium]